MTLRQYFLKYDPNKTYFARVCGVDRTQVWRWKHGKALPRLSHILKIRELTDGQVDVTDRKDNS